MWIGAGNSIGHLDETLLPVCSIDEAGSVMRSRRSAGWRRLGLPLDGLRAVQPAMAIITFFMEKLRPAKGLIRQANPRYCMARGAA